jgi:CRISPR system Cascade subunit CasA
MDNMKARCWYESTLPLYGLAECGPDALRQVQAEVGRWLAGAEMAAFFLRSAVKDAWFSAEARGDFSAIDTAFWSRTEAPFYAALQGLIEAAQQAAPFDALAARLGWQRCIGQAARSLFDEVFVGSGPIERGHPRRTALAWQQLQRSLGGTKLRQALGLPEPEAGTRPARKAPATQPTTA